MSKNYFRKGKWYNLGCFVGYFNGYNSLTSISKQRAADGARRAAALAGKVDYVTNDVCHATMSDCAHAQVTWCFPTKSLYTKYHLLLNIVRRYCTCYLITCVKYKDNNYIVYIPTYIPLYSPNIYSGVGKKSFKTSI